MAVVGIGLWSDAQWFGNRAYGKADARGLAELLVKNKDRLKSFTVLPEYHALAMSWYITQTDTNVWSRFCAPATELTTTFPPAPQLLIIGRRHHLADPDKLVADYRAAVGPLQTNLSFVVFELYSSTNEGAWPQSAPAPAQPGTAASFERH